LNAQDALPAENIIYDKDIKSVSVHAVGDERRLPIISMSQYLKISFDDLNLDYREYVYTIVHCDRNWNPSDLSPDEYLTGFNDADLDDYLPSRGTFVDYNHYQIILPNDDMGWRVSGNYLFLLKDRESQSITFTHRFVVFERLLKIAGELRRPTRYLDTHDEVQFSINTKNINLDDPMLNLTTNITQNQDWNNTIADVEPRRQLADEIFFDYHNTLVFPSMKNYRLADLRSARSSNYRIHSLNRYSDAIEVTIKTDKIRARSFILDDNQDINGAYVINNADGYDTDTESEYMWVMFSLRFPYPPPDAKVFLLGEFNEYMANDESVMECDEDGELFYREVLLKQGVYDYVYATKTSIDEDLSYEYTEGFDNRADNEYHLVIYHRSFVTKYDRVVGYARLGA
jgi:hypothetical protein